METDEKTGESPLFQQLQQIHRACTRFDSPKQQDNTLDVHKITNVRAKKIRALNGRFSTNGRLDGRARLQTSPLGTLVLVVIQSATNVD